MYVRCFNEELATIHNPQENRVLMAAISGVRPETPFWDKLLKDECKTLQELYHQADKIMCLETAWEAVNAGRSVPAEALHEGVQVGKSITTEKNEDNKKRKSGDLRWSPSAHKKKAKSPDQRVLRPPLSKYNNFTDLIRSREDVFLATEHTGVYKRPDLMQGDCSKRNQNKYYRYHKDVGHTIEEYIMLKDEIEKLIREGYLRDYVHNGSAKPRNDQGEAGPLFNIRTIFDGPHFTGETRGAQNRYL